MTRALRRSGAVVAFTWSGKMLDPQDLAFPAALAQRRFRTIENAASEEVSVGWVTAADRTGNDFAPEDLDAGSATWLRMRTDRKRLPAAWLSTHLEAAAKARGRALNARERRELKDDLAEQLLPRVLPTQVLTDALLWHERRLVLLLAAGQSVAEAFAKLFVETFGVPLQRLDGLHLALRVADAAVHGAIEKLEPVRWPAAAGIDIGDALGDSNAAPARGTQRSFGFDTTHQFIGEEFLLWLWFRCEALSGEFTLPGGRVVGIAIDDLLQMAPGSDHETQATLRRGLPTRSPEARAALRAGQRVARARIIVGEGERQWLCTIDGASMALAGVKLPEDAEECETAEDRTADRAANWLALHEIVAGVFGVFLQGRLAAGWLEKEGAELSAWMRS